MTPAASFVAPPATGIAPAASFAPQKPAAKGYRSICVARSAMLNTTAVLAASSEPPVEAREAGREIPVAARPTPVVDRETLAPDVFPAPPLVRE